MTNASTWGFGGALGGTRTPNLLIRSQMLYPLSYERWCLASLRHSESALCQPARAPHRSPTRSSQGGAEPIFFFFFFRTW